MNTDITNIQAVLANGEVLLERINQYVPVNMTDAQKTADFAAALSAGCVLLRAKLAGL